ncbi:hypothetical protein F5Y17DRAFT_317578 [Xylariaceae sp. FL0594]|nr:hypothetical protein F5Y17DRAFT_317578 [Xylariaceae sp. FL0594]
MAPRQQNQANANSAIRRRQRAPTPNASGHKKTVIEEQINRRQTTITDETITWVKRTIEDDNTPYRKETAEYENIRHQEKAVKEEAIARRTETDTVQRTLQGTRPQAITQATRPQATRPQTTSRPQPTVQASRSQTTSRPQPATMRSPRPTNSPQQSSRNAQNYQTGRNERGSTVRYNRYNDLECHQSSRYEAPEMHTTHVRAHSSRDYWFAVVDYTVIERYGSRAPGVYTRARVAHSASVRDMEADLCRRPGQVLMVRPADRDQLLPITDFDRVKDVHRVSMQIEIHDEDDL